MKQIHQTAPYLEQVAAWPAAGRGILAHHDADSVVVYQAYRPEIAAFATAHQQFGGDHFSFSRMSWVKPNFLWMMYRSGWATKPNQERVLAIRIPRRAFDGLLAAAVPSSWDRTRWAEERAWKRAVKTSSVRLQWDPDHDPSGGKEARRAVQIGLRGEPLHAFCTEWPLGIEDITPFVRAQRERLLTAGRAALLTPLESPYLVDVPGLAEQLHLDW